MTFYFSLFTIHYSLFTSSLHSSSTFHSVILVRKDTSSSASFMFSAPRFSFNCLMDVAPIIGLVIKGSASIQARATCEMVALWRKAMTSISSINAKFLSVMGHGFVLAVFARQKSTRQRTVRNHGDFIRRAHGA